jgi:hypothetical protein
MRGLINALFMHSREMLLWCLILLALFVFCVFPFMVF